MTGVQPAAKTWEPLGLPELPPFRVSVVACWYNTGIAGVWLRCSCGRELGYGEDDSEVPLGELGADAAEHLRSHGQES